MKKSRNTLGILLVVFAISLFFLHFIAFIHSGNGNFVKKFVGYFTPDYSGSFLIFIAILIFSGVYLIEKND